MRVLLDLVVAPTCSFDGHIVPGRTGDIMFDPRYRHKALGSSLRSRISENAFSICPFCRRITLWSHASQRLSRRNYPPSQWKTYRPGESFPFTYNAWLGECGSSYNYTVWLLTSPPETLMTSFTTGVFLGRFSAASFSSTTVSIY